MKPSDKGMAVAASNLQKSFAEYVQNPCTEKIDLLEQAIFIYDAVAAGVALEKAIAQYEDMVAEECSGNITRRMMEAGIVCGDTDELRYITDPINERAGELLERIPTHH